jgi:phytoene synthase
MPDPFVHCEQLVRATDKDRYLATLFAPANRRGALFALYAFNSEIARVRETIHDPRAGEIRLQWWRDALERPGFGEAQANPVAAALLDTVVRFRLPPDALTAMIEARAFDLYNDPMPTLAALEAYAAKTSSILIDLAATVLDARRADLSAAVRHGGIAFALAGLLRVAALHASRGQLYVPLDVLERHGANAQDILAGRSSAEVHAALAELRGVARTHFEAYLQAAAAIPRDLRPAFLPLALVPLDLARLERREREPLRIVEVPQWRRQWRLWRAARRM